MAKLIFGCGYLGSRVARRWIELGEKVYGVTRSERRCEELRSNGIEPIVFDITRTDGQFEFPPVSNVLFAVGFDRSEGSSIRDVYVGGLRNVLSLPGVNPDRFIYISSTGVYGQTEGNWVDESSPCEPTREGGKACLEAERELASSILGQRSIILRLAGIYGPDRLPRLNELKKGQPLAYPENGWLNLIHVDDAVEAVLQAEQRASLPSVYLVSDGCPVQRRDFCRELAREMKLAVPVFVDPPKESHVAQRASADKRISNQRLVNDLKVKLRYPSYREGIRVIAAGDIKC